MEKLWSYLARVDDNYYSFISGVVITVSLDSFMSIFSNDSFPEPKLFIISMGTFLFTLISSLYWSRIALLLDSIQNLAFHEAPDFVDVDDIWAQLLTPNLKKLKIYFFIAFAFFIVGIGFLFIKFI